MTLLKKISGIRGTIGGKPGNSLSPIDIVEMIASYGEMLKNGKGGQRIVVGRDARISGEMVSTLAVQTLIAMGYEVIDLGLSTTPTVEMAVKIESADGGIIFTASHNPKQWNALKLLNNKGEFISAQAGERMLEIAAERSYVFADVDNLGICRKANDYINRHIEEIFKLSYIDPDKIKSKKYKAVVDCVNSTGAISVIPLLEELDCEVIVINGEMNGEFAHNPEPLPENLRDLADMVKSSGADIGIAVDPDVDRLVLVCEDGSMFGEEYTIVAAADYILRHKPSPTVSNMSSSRALEDIANKYGQQHFKSAVGEVNVVEKMKEVGSYIGGEGNGGVILPDLHYGRDALVGICIILNLLAEDELSLSQLKSGYPEYVIIKKKFEIDPELNIDTLLSKIKEKYSNLKLNDEDGLRVDFEKSWVHLRKSNTEPVIRLIAEASSDKEAEDLINEFESQLIDFK